MKLASLFLKLETGSLPAALRQVKYLRVKQRRRHPGISVVVPMGYNPTNHDIWLGVTLKQGEIGFSI